MAKTVCIGCGLDTDDEGRLIVASSGAYSSLRNGHNPPDGSEPGIGGRGGPLSNPGHGQIVYCDPNGDLRTAPEKFGVRDFAKVVDQTINDLYAPNEEKAFLASGAAFIRNPSPAYSMLVMITPQVQVDAFFAGSHTDLQVRMDMSLNAEPWDQQEQGRLDPAGGGVFPMELSGMIPPQIIGPNANLSVQIRGVAIVGGSPNPTGVTIRGAAVAVAVTGWNV